MKYGVRLLVYSGKIMNMWVNNGEVGSHRFESENIEQAEVLRKEMIRWNSKGNYVIQEMK